MLQWIGGHISTPVCLQVLHLILCKLAHKSLDPRVVEFLHVDEVRGEAPAWVQLSTQQLSEHSGLHLSGMLLAWLQMLVDIGDDLADYEVRNWHPNLSILPSFCTWTWERMPGSTVTPHHGLFQMNQPYRPGTVHIKLGPQTSPIRVGLRF